MSSFRNVTTDGVWTASRKHRYNSTVTGCLVFRVPTEQRPFLMTLQMTSLQSPSSFTGVNVVNKIRPLFVGNRY